MIFFVPLIVYAALALPWRVRWRAAGLCTALILVWLIPLLWLSGGIGTYVDLSRDLASFAGGSTSVFNTGLSGLRINLGRVMSGTVTGALSVLPLLLIGR